MEAIDRKNNFPAPSVRQRKSLPSSSLSDPTGAQTTTSTTGTDAGSSIGKAVAKGIGAEGKEERVISEELRGLLSRKVVVLDKQEVVESGGGVS